MTKVKKQIDPSDETSLQSLKNKAESVFPDIDQKYILDSNTHQDLLGAVKTTSRLSTKQRTFVKDLTDIIKTGSKRKQKKKESTVDEKNTVSDQNTASKMEPSSMDIDEEKSKVTSSTINDDVESSTVDNPPTPSIPSIETNGTYVSPKKKLRLDDSSPLKIERLSTDERLRIILAKLNS